MPAAVTAPRCFLCESGIAPGEPFRTVTAYAPLSRALPGNGGNAGAGLRLVHRAVHYSCELEAVAAAGVAGAGDDPPELVVEGTDGEDLSTREKLARLMGSALDLVDIVDELF